MAKLSLLLLVLFGFIGISHGFVMGTFGTYTDFFERIEARNGAKLVLRPTFSNGNVAANLGSISYATYDPDTWCTSARLGQVNVFQSETDFSGVPILVLCTRRGGQVFTSKPSPAYKLIPTFNKYYLGPDLANREFTAGNDICSERLGPLYEESSALELLLSVPANRHLLSPQVSRQYASPVVGGRWSDRPYKDIFYAGDLSGVSARFWGATEWLDHKASPPMNDPELIQFSVTDAPVYPTSSNPLYHLEYFARSYAGTPRRPLGSSQVSCTHIEAPIKFLSTPLQQSTNSHVYGVDALSDWSTYWWLVFNEPSQSNSPVAPIHDVLFPATMTREKKDEWCEILAGPTYHAATAAQVQLALQSAFNPLGSTLTFRASPAECLVSTCTNASEFAWKFLPHDGWPNDLINYNYLSYYQKCLSASFVVADSCQPLAPVSTMADYDLRVCNNKASNEATLPSNRDACMPRLLPAQTVLDACLDRSENFPCISRCGHTNANNDTNRPGDSNDPDLQCSRAVDCPVDAGQKQSWLLHTFANSGGNLDNTDFGTITYEQRKAIFGYLACTNLPRPAEGYPADRDPYKVFNYSFEDGVEAGRLFDPTVSGVAEYTKCDYGCCSDKDNVCQTSLFPRGLVLKGLTPDEPARANRLPYSDSNGIPLPFWDTGADRYGSVSIFSATAWRIEPRRNIATLDANTLFSLSVTFTFPDEANHIVWFNGCGYDDDCYTSSSLPPMYSKDLPNAASFTEFPLTLTTTTETLTATFNFPGDCAIFAVAGWETDQSGGVDFNPGPTSASYTYSIAPSK